MVVSVVGDDVEHGQAKHRFDLADIPGEALGQSDQGLIIERGCPVVRMKQAGSRVRMQASAPRAIEPLGREISAALRGSDQPGFGHGDARRLRHLRIDIFDRARVSAVLGVRKLDEPGLITRRQGIDPVDDVSGFRMKSDHRLGTRPSRRAVEGDEVFENLVGLSPQDVSGLIGETIEVEVDLRSFGALVRLVDEGSHSTLAHMGDADALATAQRGVDKAKVGLGERGPVWWTDG